MTQIFNLTLELKEIKTALIDFYVYNYFKCINLDYSNNKKIGELLSDPIEGLQLDLISLLQEADQIIIQSIKLNKKNTIEYISKVKFKNIINIKNLCIIIRYI